MLAVAYLVFAGVYLIFEVFQQGKEEYTPPWDPSFLGLSPTYSKHQNLLFWDLSLFLKFRLKSPYLVDFWSWKCLFYWVRKKRFRLILKTRDF